MIELYHGDCRAFLSHYNGPAFDAVITDPPYASGGATLAERSASTSQKYTATKKACPFPDFMGDQMDARSWLHMMADVLALARVRCHDGAVLPGVFKAANVQGMQRIHQTQKPEEIMRQICKICLPGGRILDPFAGSGSTLAAAELEGYDSVGVELSEEIAKRAAERLGVEVKRQELSK